MKQYSKISIDQTLKFYKNYELTRYYFLCSTIFVEQTNYWLTKRIFSLDIHSSSIYIYHFVKFKFRPEFSSRTLTRVFEATPVPHSMLTLPSSACLLLHISSPSRLPSSVAVNFQTTPLSHPPGLRARPHRLGCSSFPTSCIFLAC